MEKREIGKTTNLLAFGFIISSDLSIIINFSNPLITNTYLNAKIVIKRPILTPPSIAYSIDSTLDAIINVQNEPMSVHLSMFLQPLHFH